MLLVGFGFVSCVVVTLISRPAYKTGLYLLQQINHRAGIIPGTFLCVVIHTQYDNPLKWKSNAHAVLTHDDLIMGKRAKGYLVFDLEVKIKFEFSEVGVTGTHFPNTMEKRKS